MENLSNILVTGANGFLGSKILKNLPKENYGSTRQIDNRENNNFIYLDFNNTINVFKSLNNLKPKVIIHTIANTDLDFCEAYPVESFTTNYLVTEIICNWIKNFSPNTHIIFISTDQFYDDICPSDESNVNIKNYYTLCKFLSEIIVKSCQFNTIIRTNFVGINFSKKNFYSWFLNSLLLKEEITLYNDIFFNPLFIDDLVFLLFEIVKRKVHGTFNLASYSKEQGISKAQFCLEVIQGLKYDFQKYINVSKIPNTFLAKRPRAMIMDVSSIETEVNIKMPSLVDTINKLQICTIDYLENNL